MRKIALGLMAALIGTAAYAAQGPDQQSGSPDQGRTAGAARSKAQGPQAGKMQTKDRNGAHATVGTQGKGHARIQSRKESRVTVRSRTTRRVSTAPSVTVKRRVATIHEGAGRHCIVRKHMHGKTVVLNRCRPGAKVAVAKAKPHVSKTMSVTERQTIRRTRDKTGVTVSHKTGGTKAVRASTKQRKPENTGTTPQRGSGHTGMPSGQRTQKMQKSGTNQQ